MDELNSQLAAGHSDVVAAMFETRGAASAARESLIAAGISPAAIEVVDSSSTTVPRPDNTVPSQGESGGLWTTIRHLFVRHDHAHDYAEGVGRGHSMLFVRGTPTEQSQGMSVLEGLHPVDMMSRVEDWKAAGWSGVHTPVKTPAPDAVAVTPGTESTLDPELEPDPEGLRPGFEPDHVLSTGLLHDESAVRPIGAPLVNAMGIEVPRTRTSGSTRVRRYEYNPDALPTDDV